jgi:hypothetical protein
VSLVIRGPLQAALYGKANKAKANNPADLAKNNRKRG